MNDKQFKEICNRLDKIYALLAINNIADVHDKIYMLKNLGLKSEEVNIIVGVKNCRQMEGWKRS